MAAAPICFKICCKDQTVNKDMCAWYNSVGVLFKPNKSLLKCANLLRSISVNSSEREKSSKFVVKSSSREKHLQSLDSYFGKVKENTGQYSPSSRNDDPVSSAARDEMSNTMKYIGENERALVDGGGGLKSGDDETSGLYLISTMVSINIGVYLFEIASPIKNSDLDLFSLPALYGAKINHLILYGEWWRLLTPMFLVQD